jgi:hypothetical protein
MYKIIKKNKDWKKTEIEKMSPKTFTIEEAEQNAKQYETYEREWTAQIKLFDAVIDNIKRNHPDVYALPKIKKEAAKILTDNEDQKKIYKEKLLEVKGALKKWKEEKALLMETFKWHEK